jgi:hypothetical protein
MRRFREALTLIIEAFISGFDGFINNAVGVLTMDLQDDMFEGVFITVMLISETVILPTATSIIAVCFFIEFMKISLKMDMFKWEYAISALAKFAIARAALSIAPGFIMAIYRIGTEFIDTAYGMRGASSLYDSVWIHIYSFIYDLHWTHALAMAGLMGLIFLGVFVVGVFILVMAYARMFEIFLYISVSPLAVAFLPLENSNITKRFALNFAAVVLQGLIMLVIVMIYNSLMRSIFANLNTLTADWTGFGVLLGTMLVVTLTLVTSIMKSGTLAKAILGQ